MQSGIAHQLSELAVEPLERNEYVCCYQTAFGQVLVAVLHAPEIDICLSSAVGRKQPFRPLQGHLPLLSDKQNFPGLYIQRSLVLSSANSRHSAERTVCVKPLHANRSCRTHAGARKAAAKRKNIC